MRYLFCLVLMVGCYSADVEQLKCQIDLVHEEVNSKDLDVEALKKYCRWLEDQQDDLEDEIEELKGGQKLIELGKGDCLHHWEEPAPKINDEPN